ncbi:hypothetical protein LXL04_018716 [Taraxacum kok-saghyz]
MGNMNFNNKKWQNLAMIYTRILQHPNQQLDRYFNSFRELVASHPLSELRTTEEHEAAERAKVKFKSQENEELENWYTYIDFIEESDDLNKVVKLYERCLIACANYHEYFIRYLICMEARKNMELAENALWLKEINGNIEGARGSYQLVHGEISPGLLQAIVKHANMEYCLGNVGDACSLYEETIAIEKGKEHSQIFPFLFAQYSQFLYLV